MQIFKRPTFLFILCGALLIASISLARLIRSSAANNEQAIAQQENLRLVPVATRYEYGFSDIAVLDNGDLWGVGYDGKEPKQIYYSKDVGKSWKANSVPTENFTLTAITFADRQHGWSVGNYGLLLRTTNGGESWEKLKRPTDFDLNAVHFTNPQVGYVAARTGLKNPETGVDSRGIEILRTADGGETWKSCYKDEESSDLFQIATPSESVAVAIVDGNKLLRTENGGVTWQHLDSEVDGASSVVFTSNDNGWVVGKKGSFYRSTDQGRTWQRPANLPQQILSRNWSSIDFADSGKGVAVGDGGAMAVTYDNGTTWSEANTDIKENFGLVRLHDDTGVVLGSQTIYKVTRTLHSGS